jgi:hypothetical protein
LDLKWRKWREAGGDCIMRELITCTGDKVKEYEMGGVCSIHGRQTTVFTILIGKPEVRKSLRGPRNRWEDNIIVVLRETE